MAVFFRACSAFSSICRIRSRVRPKRWPICSRVSSGPPIPNRRPTTCACRGERFCKILRSNVLANSYSGCAEFAAIPASAAWSVCFDIPFVGRSLQTTGAPRPKSLSVSGTGCPLISTSLKSDGSLAQSRLNSRSWRCSSSRFWTTWTGNRTTRLSLERARVMCCHIHVVANVANRRCCR